MNISVPIAATFQEGIFFGMAEEAYHAIPALSSTGIKHIRISPLEFWAESRWLNPDFEDEDEQKEDSFARALGKAFHARILEGLEVFQTRYVAEPVCPKDALRTDDDLKEWLVKRGLPTTGKRKQERIDRILEADPTARIWDVIEESYRDENKGKVFLAQKYLNKIELSAAMIEKHPELCKAFRGGVAEVVICWICPDTGVPCKAKLDYLKSKAIVDLKTLANERGKPLKLAVAHEFSGRRYHVQAAFYQEAASHIARLIKADRVSGAHDPAFLQKLAAGHEKTFTAVFQFKGRAPVAIGRTFSAKSMTFQIAQAEIDVAKHTYAACMEMYGGEPWVSPEPIEQFADEEFPSWSFQ